MSNYNERYDNLSEDIIEDFLKVVGTKNFPLDINFTYLSDSKLKQVIKLEKISDKYQFLLEKDILVTFNEDLYDTMISDEEMIQILIEQELDKISFNPSNGKIKITKPNLVTFTPLVDKYGVDKIMRANQVGELASEQKADMESNFTE